LEDESLLVYFKEAENPTVGWLSTADATIPTFSPALQMVPYHPPVAGQDFVVKCGQVA